MSLPAGPTEIDLGPVLLRRWSTDDLDALVEINTDPRVAEWIGASMDLAYTEQMSQGLAALADRGDITPWAIVDRDGGGEAFGVVGVVPMTQELPVSATHEIFWRLRSDRWGEGHATRAARAAIDDALGRCGDIDLVAFTAAANRRSRAVMERLGMVHVTAEDFDHPRLAAGHRLRRHVVYRPQ